MDRLDSRLRGNDGEAAGMTASRGNDGEVVEMTVSRGNDGEVVEMTGSRRLLDTRTASFAGRTDLWVIVIQHYSEH